MFKQIKLMIRDGVSPMNEPLVWRLDSSEAAIAAVVAGVMVFVIMLGIAIQFAPAEALTGISIGIMSGVFLKGLIGAFGRGIDFMVAHERIAFWVGAVGIIAAMIPLGVIAGIIWLTTRLGYLTGSALRGRRDQIPTAKVVK